MGDFKVRFKFRQGDLVEDIITGFKGRVIARSEWLNGCMQYVVKPPIDKDGKRLDGEWIDEDQLRLVDSTNPMVRKSPSGGPQEGQRP